MSKEASAATRAEELALSFAEAMRVCRRELQQSGFNCTEVEAMSIKRFIEAGLCVDGFDKVFTNAIETFKRAHVPI